MPYVLSRLTCLTRLRAIQAFLPYVAERLTHAPYLRALRALNVCIKIVLGWICRQAKLSIFHGPLETLQTVLFLNW